MRIYYVVPPNCSNQYASMTDAQAAFEDGEVWKCTGEATIDEDTGRRTITRYDTPVPAIYSECVQVRDVDRVVTARPKVWAMQWKPGRVAFLKFRVYNAQRLVSISYGKGKGVDLLDTYEARRQRYQDREITRKKRQALGHEIEATGGWSTSNGGRFRPGFLGENVDHQNFPPVYWKPSDHKELPHFDANPACRTLGDRELERWYTSAKHRALNPYAKQALQIPLGQGNFQTRQAPNPDYLSFSGRHFDMSDQSAGHSRDLSGQYRRR